GGRGGIALLPSGGPVSFTAMVDNNTLDTIMRQVSTLGAINIADGGSDDGSTFTLTIKDNTLNNIIGSRGISVFAGTFVGPLDTTIDNNTIDRLGSTSKQAIFVDHANNVTGAKVRVLNNHIGQAAALWTAGNGTVEAVLVQTENSASADVLLS